MISRFLSIGFPPSSILVIDDGSSDDTGRIAADYGVRVIRHKKNLGKGAALRSGFGERSGHRYILTIDGDGQHQPEESLLFYTKIGKYDLVIGYRFDRRGMPWDRILSNRLTSLILSLLTNQQIFDSQCGFRLIRSDALNGVRLRTNRFETESELIIKLAQKGKRIGWVPITTIYRREKSKINHLLDTLRFILLILRSFWR